MRIASLALITAILLVVGLWMFFGKQKQQETSISPFDYTGYYRLAEFRELFPGYLQLVIQFESAYPEWQVDSVDSRPNKLVLIVHKRGGWMPTSAEVAPDGSLLKFGL